MPTSSSFFLLWVVLITTFCVQAAPAGLRGSSMQSQAEQENPTRQDANITYLFELSSASFGCCSKCPYHAFCSPESGNCYRRKDKSYYKSCSPSEDQRQPQLTQCPVGCNGCYRTKYAGDEAAARQCESIGYHLNGKAAVDDCKAVGGLVCGRVPEKQPSEPQCPLNCKGCFRTEFAGDVGAPRRCESIGHHLNGKLAFDDCTAVGGIVCGDFDR